LLQNPKAVTSPRTPKGMDVALYTRAEALFGLSTRCTRRLVLLAHMRPCAGRVATVGANAALQAGHHARIARAVVVEVAAVVVVVGANIAWHLGSLAFVLVGLDDR